MEMCPCCGNDIKIINIGNKDICGYCLSSLNAEVYKHADNKFHFEVYLKLDDSTQRLITIIMISECDRKLAESTFKHLFENNKNIQAVCSEHVLSSEKDFLFKIVFPT